MDTPPIQMLTKTSPLSNMLVNGIALWRPVSIYDDARVVVETPTFKPNPKRSHELMGRMALEGTWSHQPEVYDFNYGGVVVFLNRQPPESWTHIILGGLSRKMHQPRIPGEWKGAVFARADKPMMDLEEYKEWRWKLYEGIRDSLVKSHDPDVQLTQISYPLRTPAPHGVRQLHNVKSFRDTTDIAYIID